MRASGVLLERGAGLVGQGSQARFRKTNALIIHTLVDFEKILVVQHVSTERWRTADLSVRDRTGEGG